MKTSNWIGLLVGIMALCLCIGTPAGAQTKNACADDIAKFCKDVQPGGGRLVRCMQEHEKDLSPQCKASIKEARAKAKEVHEVCADDVHKFCKDVQPGGWRIVNCLKQNEKQLSPECREKLTQAKKKAQ